VQEVIRKTIREKPAFGGDSAMWVSLAGGDGCHTSEISSVGSLSVSPEWHFLPMPGKTNVNAK
jgi:hypothetical protein